MSSTSESADAFSDLFLKYIAPSEGIGAIATAAFQASRTRQDRNILYAHGFNFLDCETLKAHTVLSPFVKFMASVSHITPAIASLQQAYQINGDTDAFTLNATSLVTSIATAREQNSATYWNGKMTLSDGSNPYAIYTDRIVAMVDYICATSGSYLNDLLEDPAAKLPKMNLHSDLIEPANAGDLSLANAVNGTFSIANLVGIHGLYLFLAETCTIEWDRTDFVFTGSFGRITGARTFGTLPFTYALHKISGIEFGVLKERSTLPLFSGIEFTPSSDAETLGKAATEANRLMANQAYNIGLGKTVYGGEPQTDTSVTNPYPPALRNPQTTADFSLRLKFALENPGMLLATFTSDFVVDQLHANSWTISSSLTVPGLTDVSYL